MLKLDVKKPIFCIQKNKLFKANAVYIYKRPSSQCSSAICLWHRSSEMPGGVLENFLLITNEMQWFIAWILYRALLALRWKLKQLCEWASRECSLKVCGSVGDTFLVSPEVKCVISWALSIFTSPESYRLFSEQAISHSHMLLMWYDFLLLPPIFSLLQKQNIETKR